MKLTIAIFEEGDWWVAQCKEIDVATQARGLPEILMAIGEALAANVIVNAELGRKPFEGLNECPDGPWRKCLDRAVKQ